MRGRIVVALLIVAVAGGLQTAAAQELRGVVRDSASQLPIPGAVVALQDSVATTLARTTTNERGQFRVVLLGDSVRRVRVVRLGFRPAVMRLPAPVDGVIRMEIPMTAVSMSLAPVQVVAGPPNCPRRRDGQLALGLLEQARAGLLATVVARSDKPARMTRLRATRTMDGYSDRVIHQRVQVESTATAFGSFGAAHNAAEFVRNGFTTDSAGLTRYFGPDAEVLLDDSFSAGYCFHLKDADPSRVHQIGLGFRPAKQRNGRTDVDGALWIDTVARALVDIEYQYLGIDPRASPFHPGGHIWFREMPNGAVVIERWLIRFAGRMMPGSDGSLPAIRSLTSSGRPVARLQTEYGVEVSGELAHATWADGFTWVGPLGTAQLRAVNAAGLPAIGAVVRLDDTDYQATSDSAGNIELSDLVPGRYTLSLVDPELASLGLTVPTSFELVAARRWTLLLRLPMPELQGYVSQRCAFGGTAIAATVNYARTDDASIIGRVVATDGQRVSDAKWTLRVRDMLGTRTLVRDAELGSDGVFQYCNVKRGQTVEVTVRAKGMADASASATLSKPPAVMTIVMHRKR